VSDSRLLHFLFALAQDPIRASEFRRDPETALSGVDLSAEQQEALRSRDPSKIRAALVERPLDQDLLFLTWLGSLADEPVSDP
jgi:hypothetical protein